jgi:hypothetical protein
VSQSRTSSIANMEGVKGKKAQMQSNTHMTWSKDKLVINCTYNWSIINFVKFYPTNQDILWLNELLMVNIFFETLALL